MFQSPTGCRGHSDLWAFLGHLGELVFQSPTGCRGHSDAKNAEGLEEDEVSFNPQRAVEAIPTMPLQIFMLN